MKKVTKSALAIAAIILFATVTGCNDDNNDVVLPPIGGYNNSGEVGAANLVSYWSFDGTYTESKANLAGVATGSNFSTGIKGQGYQGSSSASSYVTYASAGTALPALQSFTSSFWIKSAQPTADLGAITPGLGAQGIFDIVNTTGFWGNLHFNLEPFRSVGAGVTTPNSDTLLMKMEVTNTNTGVVWVNQFPTVFLKGAVNTWTHVAITYDGGSGRLTFYQNGAMTGTNSVGAAYGPFSGTTILYANDPGSATNTNSAAIYGNLKFENASKLVIGTWQLSTTPPLTTGGGAQAWATNYTGSLDEMRIWNKALVDAEINSLYELEKAGR